MLPNAPQSLGLSLCRALAVLRRLQPALQLQRLLLQAGGGLGGAPPLHLRRRLALVHFAQERLGAGGAPLWQGQAGAGTCGRQG